MPERRARLEAELAELVARKWITPAEAQAILDLFDADQLPAEAWPDPIADDDDRQIWLIALIGASLAAGLALGRARVDRRRRDRTRDRLRLAFEETIGRLAVDVHRSGNVAAWQRAMRQTIGDYARQMAIAGYGGPIPFAAQANLAGVIAQQERYLARFARQIAARQAAGRPMSDLYIATRGRMYGGAPWAQFFAHAEAADDAPGIVYEYIAVDDFNTCAPCSAHNGRFYLAGQGPYPGDICAGAGNCRCERVPIFDPVRYAELTGLALAA